MAKPIYLVGGSKGGVGKSIVTMALIDSLQSLDETVLLVETDTTNPDVWMCYRDEVETATLDLDEADGWIALINRCESQPDHPVIINTAARNNHGVSVHGVTLDSTLAELQRPLVTFSANGTAWNYSSRSWTPCQTRRFMSCAISTSASPRNSSCTTNPACGRPSNAPAGKRSISPIWLTGSATICSAGVWLSPRPPAICRSATGPS